VPELLMRSTSPYGSRRAVLLRGSGDIYLYLEDVTGEAAETSSAVWVANQAVAPVHPPDPTDTTVRNDDGGPPRMAATGTRHPEGCPPLQDVEFVWFEEGDGVALVDGEGIVAVVPGWGGRDDFYGYSRYAQGHTPIAWELSAEALDLLTSKVEESRDFWAWRTDQAWGHIRSTGIAHLEQAIGPQEVAWPLGESSFPELIASRHRYGDPGHEVLGLGVVADEGRGGLLGLVLEPGVLVDLDADALGVEQLGHRLVVLEVRAGRVAPRVAAAAVLLAEQAGHGGRARPRRRSPTPRGCGGASSSARASAISTPMPCSIR
jgi:hypothetical protein